MFCPKTTRTRFNGDTQTLRRWFVYGSIDPYYEDYGTYPIGEYSSITDEVLDYNQLSKNEKKQLAITKASNGSFCQRTFNDVYHTSGFQSDGSDYVTGSWHTSPTMLMTEYATFALMREKVESGNPVFEPSLQDFSQQQLWTAFNSLIPSFKDAKVDGINLYTFLLELADVKKLFVKTTYQFTKTFRDIPEKNLAINFGALPFASDMIAIHDILFKLNDYIDKWNLASSAGSTWDKHVSISSSNENIVLNTEDILLSSSTIRSRLVGALDKKSKATLHMYFKPRFIPDDKRRRVFYRALGLGRPLVGVWEAVPFSWAIDYFYNVGELISRFDEPIKSVFQFDFVDAGYSIKGTVKGRYDCHSYAYTSYCTQPYSSFSNEIDSSVYVRRKMPLKTVFDFISKPPEVTFGWSAGKRQLSYLASVAYLRTFK